MGTDLSYADINVVILNSQLIACFFLYLYWEGFFHCEYVIFI